MSFVRKFFSKSIKKEITEQAIQIAAASNGRFKSQMAYNGGSVIHSLGDDRAGGAKYTRGISESSNYGIDHYRLRANARDAYHDTPQARALVERYADTVADTGLMLEAAPKAGIIGISPEKAEAWASETEEAFDSWARERIQHRAETMNWYQSHRLYQIFQHRDNDVFTRLFYSPDSKLLNPLQFDFIDPNQIRGDAYTSVSYANGIQDDGIIRDDRGREVAYKVWVSKGPNRYEDIEVKRIGPRSGRVMMLHGFSTEYAGQGRGYSRLGYALQEFQNLTDFSLSIIQKALNQSSVSMYVKPASDAPASNPFEGLLTKDGAGPAAAQFGATAEPAADAVNVTATNPVRYHDMPEATIRKPGGVGVFNLEAGEDMKPFEGKVASESFNTFVDAFCGYLSSAMSMPLEVLLMKFNQNYSASRATLILFWRVVNIWREEMVSDYCNPTYAMWLAGEVASGRRLCPGWADPRIKAAWLNCRWIGGPMPNIDPEKTAKADMLYIEMGAQTLDRAARNFNGSSGKSNRVKLSRELPELTPVPWNKQTSDIETTKDEEDDNA